MFISFPKYRLKRNIGLFTLCVIGINGTIGGGIFVLMGHGATVAGQWLPVSFLLGGILAFMGALMYAELGTAIPKAGADLELVFNVTRKRYYPFIFSWLVLLGDIGYLAINALGLAFYVNFFMPVNPTVFGLVALLFAGLINLRGTESTGKSEVVTGAGLFLLLTIYTGLAVANPGFSFEVGELIARTPGQFAPILAATSLIFTTYVGYEYIASIAEEAENPDKNIPKALMITIVASSLLFVMVSWATVNAIPVSELASSDAPFLLIAERLGGIGYYVVIPAAITATAGSLLAAAMVSSRRLYALSGQGYFNRFFAVLNGSDSPYRSIMAVIVLAAVLLLTGSVTFVAYMSNTVYLVGLVVIAISLMSLRRQRPYLPRPFRVPLYPYIPIAMIVLCLSVIAFIGLQSLTATAIWALFGYFVYLATRIHYRQLYLAVWGAILFLLLISIAGVIYLI